jgi:hypothetical protein
MIAPIFSAAPTMLDPDTGTRVWLFDEVTTMVDQTLGPMSAGVGRFLTGPVEAELQRRWISAGKKVRFIHDWRSCSTYETEARNLILEWGRQSKAHSQQVVIQLAPDASPFVKIAASTGVSLLKAARMPIDLVDDLTPFITELSALAPR